MRSRRSKRMKINQMSKNKNGKSLVPFLKHRRGSLKAESLGMGEHVSRARSVQKRTMKRNNVLSQINSC